MLVNITIKWDLLENNNIEGRYNMTDIRIWCKNLNSEYILCVRWLILPSWNVTVKVLCIANSDIKWIIYQNNKHRSLNKVWRFGYLESKNT